MKARAQAAALALVLLAGTRAAAEPTHLLGASTVTMHESGHALDLPPGYFLPEDDWDALDLEVHRLQDSETKLKAENQSLRKSAGSWGPGFKTSIGILIVGAAVGAYAAHRWW